MTDTTNQHHLYTYPIDQPFDCDYFIQCAKYQIRDAKRFNLPAMLKQGEDRLAYWTNKKTEES